MQSEVCLLFNTVSSYKDRLSKVLNRIDYCLQNTSVARLEPVSVNKKHKISTMLINIIKKYVKMLYIGENVLEELLVELFQMERDTEPERVTHTWNPFYSIPSSSSSSFHPNILNKIEKNRSFSHCTASSDFNMVSTTERMLTLPCPVDAEVQTDTFKSVDAGAQTVVEFETQSLKSSSGKAKPKELDVCDVAVIIDELEKDQQKLQSEGLDSNCGTKSLVQDSGTNTKLKETLFNLPKVPPRKYLKREVKNVTPNLPKREKLGIPPLCQSSVAGEVKKMENPSPDWREDTLKLFQNKKVRSNLSLKNKNTSKEKTVVYDILEEELHVDEICTFSHIHTPSEFYVHIKGPTLYDGLQNALNDDVNYQFQYVVSKYKTKEEAKTQLGNFCCGFISSKRKWFRVEVLDWMFEDRQHILVQLIDHGEKIYCNYTHLKALNEFYAKTPRLAVRCHLAAVCSTDPTNRTKWSKESIDCLIELADIKRARKFKIFYLSREGNSYAVDLLREPSTNEISVGKTLINKGLAFQVDNTWDDCLEKISEKSETFENLNEAVADNDTRDEAGLCHVKGPLCKQEDECLAKVQKTIVDFVVPAAKQYILILITGRINTCHFYATNLTKPASSYPYYNEEYFRLREAMNANNIVETYEEFKVFPVPSELVLVKQGSEWLRGKCIGFERDTISIFLIDFGMIVFKKINDLRQIKDDFLCVPPQAIECVLHHSQEKPDLPLEESVRIFRTFMHMRLFTALVVESGLPLRLQLWDEKKVDLDYVLRSYGIAQRRYEHSAQH